MNDSSRKLLMAYRWPIVFLGLGTIFSFFGMMTFLLFGKFFNQNFSEAVGLTSGLLDRMEQVISGKHSVSLKTSFLADIPKIADAGAGRLELAKVDRIETLRSEDTLALLWDHISLGTTFVEIRIPVTYRYYVDLNDAWEMRMDGKVCRVRAPRLRSMLPPAIHTHRMEKRMENGWARFNAESQMDALEQQLTPTMVQYAEQASLMVLVRDQAQKSLARFIRQWLLQQPGFRDESVSFVKVTFHGEPDMEGDLIETGGKQHE